MGLGKDIKGVIFDLDGTLYNFKVDWQSLRTEIEKKTNKKYKTINEALESLHGKKKKSAVDLIKVEEIHGVREGSVIAGAKEVVEGLSSKYSIAIVTRNGRESALMALAALGFRNNGEVLIAREDVRMLKPHTEGFELALDNMGLLANEVIVVGDTRHDVEAARKLGMTVIVVDNPSLEYIPKGDYNIQDLMKLSSLLK